jgi:hypothetical protein
MIGTITPLVYAANHGRRRWFTAVAAYAAGTAATTITLGLVAGLVGRMFGGPFAWGGGALAAFAFTLAIYEGWLRLRLPLPMIERQTHQFWRTQFGITRAALLWGADIGLVFTTRTTFASVWFLLVAATITASPLAGVVIVAGYGAGRVLLVLSGPLLGRRDVVDGSPYFGSLPGQATWHYLHAGLLIVGGMVVLLGGTGS